MTTDLPLVADPAHGWAVWGQDPATGQLQRSVASLPSHAYIFTGPSGSGKRLAALNFAMALCCQAPPAPGRFCGSCSPCRRIARGVFPDVALFDLRRQAERDGDKSRNLTLNIATVREVASALSFRPTEAKWRIAIVDDAETMQETAQEAFLKTLEEPPPYALVILLATDAERLLDTIRSRCATIRFGPSPRAAVVGALLARGLAPNEAEEVSRYAEGLIGWAVRAVREPALLQQRREIVDEAIELIQAEPYDRMVRAVRLADGFTSDRLGTIARLQAIQAAWRSTLLAALGVSDDRELLADIPAVATASVEDIVRAVQSVERCIENLESNVRPRLALESMVMSWPR